jgi:hypothetical protein
VTPVSLRRELVATLEVPEGESVSTLEWMRTPVTRLSGRGVIEALDRTSYVLGLGTGAVAPVKLAELVRGAGQRVVAAASRSTTIPS